MNSISDNRLEAYLRTHHKAPARDLFFCSKTRVIGKTLTIRRMIRFNIFFFFLLKIKRFYTGHILFIKLYF